jgi:cephalosporin-C deacetylase-like acetyl esterase
MKKFADQSGQPGRIAYYGMRWGGYLGSIIPAIEDRIKSVFELLGTPDEHKRLILYETDHIPPRVEYIKETLAWLDKYLGPVR